MIIRISNPSSPGASLTKNTNGVILKMFDWVTEHPSFEDDFVVFRKQCAKDMNFNDNNNRNILPLLKNLGFIQYEAGEKFSSDSFFTDLGKAYVKALKSIDFFGNPKSLSEEQASAFVIHELMTQQIARVGFKNLIETETHYKTILCSLLRYLLAYEKINKEEFARLVQSIENSEDIASDNLKNDIKMYREGSKRFEVTVIVRNDIDIRNRTHQQERDEGIGFLTSFTYFSSLLLQTGITTKDDGYLVANNKEIIKAILS